MPSIRFAVLSLVAFLSASPAHAHLNPDEHGSFMAGLSHPVFGLDHILAMVAVGLWAALIGGRAVWFLPSAFVGAMIIGFILAVAGLALPFVEPMILVSVVALGLVVAFMLRLPILAATGLVAVFGLFHGHAHGGELGTAAALDFGIGFVVATAVLHALGVTLAMVAENLLSNGRLVRGLGLATAFAGLWIATRG